MILLVSALDFEQLFTTAVISQVACIREGVEWVPCLLLGLFKVQEVPAIGLEKPRKPDRHLTITGVNIKPMPFI